MIHCIKQISRAFPVELPSTGSKGTKGTTVPPKKSLGGAIGQGTGDSTAPPDESPGGGTGVITINSVSSVVQLQGAGSVRVISGIIH